jgi:carbazole 1,9a-dioxygenase terminal dioxygenase component
MTPNQEQRRSGSTLWDTYLEARFGFRNHWYAAFFGAELAEADSSRGMGEPVANMRSEVILGERILFRRVGGRVYAVQDQCLHKGVPFSKKPECYTPGTLTCWYHGFTYDLETGMLRNVITDPGCPLIGRLHLKTYPVEERQGMVFVFVGDIEPPPLEHDLMPGFLDQDLTVYPNGWSRLVACNWRLGVENGFDPTHAYMHRNSPLVRGFKVPTVLGDAEISQGHGMEIVNAGRAEDGPCGVRLLRGKGRPIWTVEVADGVELSARYLPDEPGAMQGMVPEVGIWMPGALRVDPFPAPHIVHFEWFVPVDERSHRYLMTWGTRAADAREEKAFFDEVTYLWRDFVPQKFNNDDMFAGEAMDEFYLVEDGWHREHLFGPDVVVTAWRKLCSNSNRGVQTLPYGPQKPTR